MDLALFTGGTVIFQAASHGPGKLLSNKELNDSSFMVLSELYSEFFLPSFMLSFCLSLFFFASYSLKHDVLSDKLSSPLQNKSQYVPKGTLTEALM